MSLHEQRNSVRMRQNMLHQHGRERLATGHPLQQLRVLRLIEAAQHQSRHMCLAHPGWDELRPEGYYEQHWPIAHPRDQQVQQLPGWGIDPMHISQSIKIGSFWARLQAVG